MFWGFNFHVRQGLARYIYVCDHSAMHAPSCGTLLSRSHQQATPSLDACLLFSQWVVKWLLPFFSPGLHALRAPHLVTRPPRGGRVHGIIGLAVREEIELDRRRSPWPAA